MNLLRGAVPAQIHSERMHPDGRLELVGQSLKGVRVASDQNQIAAIGGGLPGQLETDPGARTGHEREGRGLLGRHNDSINVMADIRWTSRHSEVPWKPRLH